MKIRTSLLSIMALLCAAPLVAMEPAPRPSKVIISEDTIDTINTVVIQVMEEFTREFQKSGKNQKRVEINARERLHELIAQVPAVTMGELKRALTSLVTNLQLFDRAEVINVQLVNTVTKSFDVVLDQIQNYANGRNLKLTLQRNGKVKPSTIAKPAASVAPIKPVAPVKPAAVAAPKAVAPVAPLKKAAASMVAAVQKKAAAPVSAPTQVAAPVVPAVAPAQTQTASVAQAEPVAVIAPVSAPTELRRATPANMVVNLKKITKKQTMIAAGITGLGLAAYSLYRYFAPAAAPQVNAEPVIDTSFEIVDTYLN